MSPVANAIVLAVFVALSLVEMFVIFWLLRRVSFLEGHVAALDKKSEMPATPTATPLLPPDVADILRAAATGFAQGLGARSAAYMGMTTMGPPR